MNVLIRGMEMPENCFECPCCRHDSIDGIKAEQCNLTLDVFGVNNTERWIGRGQNCPLIEVELVEDEEAIVPVNMIGGYLKREAEHEEMSDQ